MVSGPAGGQVSRDLPGGEHPSGARTGQALPQVTHQLGIRQYLDRLAQPVQLTRGHHVRDVVAVRMTATSSPCSGRRTISAYAG